MAVMMSKWAMRTTILLAVFLGVLGTNHSVGGPSGWDLSSNVKVWSAANTFYVGDILVFTYTPVHSVLEVNQLEYKTCRTMNPILVNNSSPSVVHLTQPGTRYFIGGQNGDCAMGLKFRVDVLPQLAGNDTFDGLFQRPHRRPPLSPSNRPSHPPAPPIHPPSRPPPPQIHSPSRPPPSIPDFEFPWPPPALVFPPPTPEIASPPGTSPEISGVSGTMRARCLESFFATLLFSIIDYLLSPGFLFFFY